MFQLLLITLHVLLILSHFGEIENKNTHKCTCMLNKNHSAIMLWNAAVHHTFIVTL